MGHGFVSAYFDGYDQPFLFKRYRCPDCRCVVRLRPEEYFKRFQASIETIRLSIASKSQAGKWIAAINHSRQRHWFRALCKRIKAYLVMQSDSYRNQHYERVVEYFNELLKGLADHRGTEILYPKCGLQTKLVNTVHMVYY